MDKYQEKITCMRDKNPLGFYKNLTKWENAENKVN